MPKVRTKKQLLGLWEKNYLSKEGWFKFEFKGGITLTPELIANSKLKIIKTRFNKTLETIKKDFKKFCQENRLS